MDRMSNFSGDTSNPIETIKIMYARKRQQINRRLEDFTKIWERGEKKEIFIELVFCILTPQANGKACWSAVENMITTRVLFAGDRSQIAKELHCARFIHKKSAYIVEAREKFFLDAAVSLKSIISRIDNAYHAREWLVKQVKGMGYKEASHFLRNIGFERNLAILDRHIMKNLHAMGIITKVPPSLSKGIYMDIERRMQEFSQTMKMPMGHLDLILWYKETGEIFK